MSRLLAVKNKLKNIKEIEAEDHVGFSYADVVYLVNLLERGVSIMASVNEWVHQVHENAVTKGWHDRPREDLEVHALIHTEVAEATEAVRVGDEKQQQVELVDTVIRIWDHFGAKGWDFEKVLHEKHEYNKTRTRRHGNKLK